MKPPEILYAELWAAAHRRDVPDDVAMLIEQALRYIHLHLPERPRDA